MHRKAAAPRIRDSMINVIYCRYSLFPLIHSHSNSNFKEYGIVTEFILKLQEDYKFLLEFRKDPDKVMIEAGISSQKLRNIIKSGDITMIRQLIAEERE